MNQVFPKPTKGAPAEAKLAHYHFLRGHMWSNFNSQRIMTLIAFFGLFMMGLSALSVANVTSNDFLAITAATVGVVLIIGDFLIINSAIDKNNAYEETIKKVTTDYIKLYVDTYGEMPPINPNAKEEDYPEIKKYLQERNLRWD